MRKRSLDTLNEEIIIFPDTKIAFEISEAILIKWNGDSYLI